MVKKKFQIDPDNIVVYIVTDGVVIIACEVIDYASGDIHMYLPLEVVECADDKLGIGPYIGLPSQDDIYPAFHQYLLKYEPSMDVKKFYMKAIRDREPNVNYVN